MRRSAKEGWVREGGKLIRAAWKTERKPSNESKMEEKLVGNRNGKPSRRERNVKLRKLEMH